ncbi:MAG: hypothetical protein HZY75_01350 [Nocardioidaceae bacterium]|nr:MAG: hypothetical protein HZY75_01350 [Nocardioidaceae bacterium]
MSSDFRIAPAVTARFVGGILLLVGVIIFVTAALVVGFDLHPDILSVMVVLGVVTVVVLGFLVSRIGVLLTMDDVGYRTRWLRAPGAKQARWTDVEDVVTGFASEQAVLVIRLKDGQSTTIPVNLLAADSADLVKAVQEHAQRGRGYRRLS